ncbi:MAG: PD-(D/E)XK nuclease family transposase, partial [Rectinemataceae bacterium]
MLLAVNDFVFKFIFGVEERKELLRSLINLTLERAGLPLAATLTLRNPFVNPNHEDDKASVLDVEATDDHE